MITLCYYRELIIRLIARQHKVEEHCLMYFRVLSHKANDLKLKQALTEAITGARERINVLQSLLSSMNASAKGGGAAGVKGIMREGFQSLDHEPDTVRQGALIRQTVISSYHYKIGNYRMILRYCHALDWEYEAYVVQPLLNDLEMVLQGWVNPLASEPHDISAKFVPPPVASPPITDRRAVEQQTYV